MPLDPNRFTRKTNEALSAAQANARERRHSQVGSMHLLAALIGQPEGVVLPVLQRVGVAPKSLLDQVNVQLAALPQVYGDTAQNAALAPEAYRVLESADQHRQSLDDDYLSTEHLLLAMVGVAGGVGDLLRGLAFAVGRGADVLEPCRHRRQIRERLVDVEYQEAWSSGTVRTGGVVDVGQ